MAKRKLFDELMEGVAAMKAPRDGKVTLCTYRLERDNAGNSIFAREAQKQPKSHRIRKES